MILTKEQVEFRRQYYLTHPGCDWSAESVAHLFDTIADLQQRLDTTEQLLREERVKTQHLLDEIREKAQQ